MYVKVRVTAGVKKEHIEEKDSHTLRISVTEQAKQNRANTRVRECVAAWYALPVKSVRIVSGHHSASKILSIPDDV